MDNQEIGAVILKIYEEQKKTNKKIDGVEVEIKTLTSEVRKIDERLTSEVDKINKRLTSEVNKINEKITNEVGKINEKITNEVGKINERITSEVDKINERITIEIGKIDERITIEVGKINERITIEVGKINQRITNEIGQMNRKFDSEIGKVNKRLDKLELEGKDTREIIKIMQQEIRSLRGDIAVIQYEHGKKLDILFDAITGNEERNKENQERLDNIEKILEKHPNQIYYLEKRA